MSEELPRRLLFLPEQGSTFAPRVDHLHYFIIAVTLVAALGLGALGLFFLIRYRRRAEPEATPIVHAPVWLEVLFMGAPLGLFLLWFVMGFGDYVWASAPPRDALDVYVTAKQWMWKFSYPEGPSEIGVLHVPAGRPVRLLLTSRDVVHSFFVPDFRLKRDVVPSRYTEAWFEAPQPGNHPVMCAEFCGLDHSVMAAEVVVLAPADFEAWRAKRLPAISERTDEEHGPLVERGRAVAAEVGCLRCHSIDGSRHIGPTFLGLYGRDETLSDGSHVIADEAYLTRSMMEPGYQIVAGYPPLMPSFFGQLTPAQTAALLEYLKSLRAEHASNEESP